MAVHSINKVRESLGEFHHLFQQLKDDPEKFFQYTRMHRKTFSIILEAITPFIERKGTDFKKPITPEERLVITLRLVKSTLIQNAT